MENGRMRHGRMGGGRMRIRIGAGAAVMAAGILLETWRTGGRVTDWLPVLAAALLHELGHLAAARLCGVKVSEFRLDVMGARMRMDGLMGYGTEWAVAVAGPLTNGLSAALTLPLWWGRGGEPSGGLFLFLAASLTLGAVNLLPVGTLDGGRMLYCFLARWAGEGVAAAALRVTSAVCLGVLWLGAGYVLLRTGGMLSLFVFALCLLMRMTGGEKGRGDP